MTFSERAIEAAGPIGFRFIEDAPRDGTFVRLRFRRVEGERIGRWVPDAALKGGGAWFDSDGGYITPGPIYWASAHRRI
jgi:hypothetical protein